MSDSINDLEMIVGLVKDVKPILADTEIKEKDKLIETLGLDSLDVLQLARKVRRKFPENFDQENWLQNATDFDWTVESLLLAVRRP